METPCGDVLTPITTPAIFTVGWLILRWWVKMKLVRAMYASPTYSVTDLDTQTDCPDLFKSRSSRPRAGDPPLSLARIFYSP